MNLDLLILAYSLSEKRLLLSIKGSVPVGYFHSNYQGFYKILLHCFSKFQEVPTIRVMKEESGKVWDDSFELIYKKAIEISVDPKEFPADLEKLKERFNAQRLLKLGEEIFQENWNGEEFRNLKEANIAIKKLSNQIDVIYREKIFSEGSLKEGAKDTWNEYKEIVNNPEAAKGIHLGLRQFDRITNGLQESELLLIGGESSSGKSALAMNMAINAWLGNNKPPSMLSEFKDDFDDSGCNILVFTIEMPFKSFRRRINACMSGIPLYGIRDGTLNEGEIEKFKAGLKFQKHYHKEFKIIDIPRGCTVQQIESKYLETCYDFVPDIILIDYISLMTPDENHGSDWLNLGRLAEQVHEFVRTYNSRVISPVQLNRPPRNGDSSPDQHRVGRSSMLPQNANILLNIESRKDEELRPDMVIRIAKMRDGERGSFTLNKRFDIMKVYDDMPGWTPASYNSEDK